MMASFDIMGSLQERRSASLRRWTGARRALVAVATLAASCSPPETNVLNYPVASGGTLVQHVSRQSPSVILLLDPADIVVCGNHISRWMEWDRRNPGRLSIVFTRAPSEADRRQLLLFRIKPDVVLGTSRGYTRIPTPYEYLVVDGSVVLSEQVPVGSPESPLLRAFEEGQVAALLQSGPRTFVNTP
jgi:hypothetical protein